MPAAAMVTPTAPAFCRMLPAQCPASGVRHTPGPDIGERFSLCRNGDVSPQFGAGGRERSWTFEPGWRNLRLGAMKG